MRKFKNRFVFGFSLIELLVVIAIIGILVGLAVVAFSSIWQRSRDAQRKSDVSVIQGVLEEYHTDWNLYPPQLPFGSEFSYNQKIYLRKVPVDPLPGNPQYYYQGSECNENGCASYTLYARLENGGSYSIVVGGADYNYAVTPLGEIPLAEVPPEESAPILVPAPPPPGGGEFTPTPAPVLCALTSASWSTTTTVQGQTVSLNVAGTDCAGEIISFEVRRNGLFATDIPANAQPSPVILNSLGQGAGSWVAEFNPLIPGTNPDYYFKAVVSSGSVVESNPRFLKVSPAVSSPPPPSPSPPPPTPTISLSASPSSITSGLSSMLTWSSVNTTSCAASGAWSGTKAVSGTQSVSPASSSTYTLTCTGSGGTISSSATVTVTVPPPPVLPAPTATLSTSPDSITSGSSATLTWSTSNATSVSINQNIGTVAASGSRSVNPTTTTTYALTATNSTGTVTKSVTLTVNQPLPPSPPPPPPTLPPALSCSLSLAGWSTATIVEGSMVNLNVTGSAACSGKTVGFEVRRYGFLIGDISATTQPASVVLNSSGQGSGLWTAEHNPLIPFTDPTYYFKATIGQSVLRSNSPDLLVTFTSSAPTPAPTATLSVSPETITSGSSATLTWSTSNATSVSINQNIGTVAASGSRSVNPTTTTTYALTATNSTGTVTKSVTLTVNQPLPPSPPPLKNNGEACTADAQCASNICGTDRDNDAYFSKDIGHSGTCQAVSRPYTDCCDNSAQTYPGQTNPSGGNYFNSANNCGSWDYNCDGQITKDWEYTCSNSNCYRKSIDPIACGVNVNTPFFCTTNVIPVDCGEYIGWNQAARHKVLSTTAATYYEIADACEFDGVLHVCEVDQSTGINRCR